MAQPLVSVVIPIYNVEKYLNRCIESVVGQTYKNLEIILVDDGSLDACPQMCDEWVKKDSRIKAVHKENAGLGMARNTGIGNANGKYIFFFDSDDYVDITVVEKCVESAERNGAEAVIFGRVDVYEDGREVEKPINSEKSYFSRDEILHILLPAMFTYDLGFGISAWGKMYSLCSFKESGIRFLSEREIISEDAYFALEFFSNIQAATIVGDNLYYYCNRDSSLSRSYRKDRQEKNDIFIQKALQYIKAAKLPKKVAVHLIARYHMYTISAMKQVMMSGLPDSQKRLNLAKMLKNKNLHKTISKEVLNVHKGTLKIFYLLLKLRMYCLCKSLLIYKTRRKGA